MGDDDHDQQEEGEETQQEIPPVWKAALGDPSEEDKAPAGAKVGEIVRILNDMEPADFKAAVAVRNPRQVEETLLGWATKKQKFVLVEWLIKKAAQLSDPNNGGEEGLGGRKIAFAFGSDPNKPPHSADAKIVDKEMKCYEKWVEKRKEDEERQKEKEEARKEALAAGEEPAEEEEAEEEEPLWQKVKAELDEEDQDDAMVQSVGQLGVWQGKRMGGKKGKGAKWGSGQAIFPNGDMYVGEYRENKRHGYGTYVWAAEGNIYIGEWENNHRSGTGRMVYANGGRYFGQWRFDKRNGKGRYTYPNGDTYSGPWVNDTKEGPQGTFTFGRQRDGAEDGSQYIGTFRGGEFVNGEWRLGGGTRYYGVFRNFQPVGKGIFVHRHGHEGSYTQDGTYKDGKWYPSRLRGADEPDPDLDLVVQGRTLRLRFTKEASGQQRGASCPIAALVQVANFTPFENWVRGLHDPAHPYYKKNFLVRGIEVRSIDWCPVTKEVQSVRLKIDALNDDGERWARLGCPDSESITLTMPTCLVIVLLRHGNEERVLWTKKPVLSCGDVCVPSLPQVQVVGAAINGNVVDKLRGLGIDLHVGTCQSLTKLTEAYGSQVGGMRAVKGMRLHEPETDALQDVMYYAQDVTKEWWDTLDEKVEKSNMPGDLEKLQAVPLQEAVATTPDAASLAALYLHQKLREAKRVGNETVEPMRPPTPPPPGALERPDIPPPPAPLAKKEEEGEGNADGEPEEQ